MSHCVHKLIYQPSSKRWHAYEGKNYCLPIHCGDLISIKVQERYFLARVELDTHWYLLIDDTKFRLHPKQKYDAILMF